MRHLRASLAACCPLSGSSRLSRRAPGVACRYGSRGFGFFERKFSPSRNEKLWLASCEKKVHPPSKTDQRLMRSALARRAKACGRRPVTGVSSRGRGLSAFTFACARARSRVENSFPPAARRSHRQAAGHLPLSLWCPRACCT